MARKTAFDRYISKELKKPGTRAAYDEARAEIDTVDRLVRALDAMRVAAGVSKADLARSISAKPEIVRRLFTSHGSNPTLATLAKLAAALGHKVALVPIKPPPAAARSQSAMKVLSLGWLGVRTPHAEAMSAFYRDVLGLELLHEDLASARFRLADGTEAHVYGKADAHHEFFGSGPVVGFAVASFAAARAALVRAGIELLYPEPQRQQGRAWQHFRAPDGNVYEIIGADDLDA